MDSPRTTNTRFAGSPLSIGLVALGVCLTIWLMELTHWTQGLDELAYDVCVSWQAAQSDAPTSVVTVYVQRSTLESEQDRLARIVQILRSQGVLRVGVAVPLDTVSSELARELAGRRLVVLGHRSNQPDRRDGISHGTVDLIDDQRVYRQHYGMIGSEFGRQPSLEAAIAREVLLPTEVIPAGRFRINYRGGTNTLPHFDEDEVLAGDLVSEIVAGKVVLIGLRPDTTTPRIATPGQQGARMSALEVHGHILRTLLTRTAIHDVGVIARATLITILTLIGFLTYQRLAARWMLPVCVGMVAAMTLISWILMAATQHWFPVTSAIIGQVFCCGFHLERRLNFLNAATSRLTLQRKISAANTNSTELWQTVADQTTQMFFPFRFVLLELSAADTYCRIVKTVNCDEHEIVERRRDSRRAPFVTAVAQGKPYISESRPFFQRQPGANDPHVVVPLIFADEVLGFTILEFESGAVDSAPDLLPQLQRFAEAVAAAVAGQRASRQQNETTIRQLLTTIPEEGAIRDVVRSEELSHRRLDQLERLFERAQSGLAMYDAFGQLTVMNTTMRSELQRRGVVVSDTRVAQLIASLSGMDQNESRDVLRDVALGTKSRKLHVPGQDELASMLYIHPLIRHGNDDVLLTSQTDAVLIEFVSSDPFASIMQLKDRIATQLCGEFARKVDQLYEAVRALADGAQSPEMVHQTTGLMKDGLIDLQATLRQGRSYLSHTGAEPNQCLPVCVLESLKSPLHDVTKACGERRIAVDHHLGTSLPEVIANPILLEQTFRAILELILETAYDESTIVVTAENAADQLTFRFANQGHGTATDRLRDALQTGPGQIIKDRQRAVQSWLEHWDGHMTIATRPGQGIEVQLVLRVHKWASSHRIERNATSTMSLLELPNPPADRPSQETAQRR